MNAVQDEKERPMPVVKWIDIPPVWLVGAIVAAWAEARFVPLGLSLAHPITQLLSGLLIGAGILLMALAIHEMRRQKTTVIPHQDPSRLVQSGIFSRSRNPIYLGDVLLLAGLILKLDAVLSLLLIPLFLLLMERRFVVPEENRLRSAFRADWGRYEQIVRRWL